MKYQNPQFLYFLFFLLIPIILHLINLRRYKKIYFSSNRFLKSIKEKSREKLKLKNLLILISRLLSIIFLVIAFSNPYLFNKNKEGKESNDIVLYIDNSLSMSSISDKGILIEKAKETAIEIIKSHSIESSFHIITNEFNPALNKSLNKNLAIEKIIEINSCARTRDFEEIIKKKKTLLNKGVDMYVITDMQKSTFDPESFQIDSTTNYFLLPMINKKISNLFIDSVWLASPIYRLNKSLKLNVRIGNSSESELIDIPIKIILNNKQKSQKLVSFKKNEKKDLLFDLFTDFKDIQEGKVIVEDNIHFDNTFFFSFTKKKKSNVLLIHEEKNDDIITLFENDTNLFAFESMSYNKIQYEKINKKDLIILYGLNHNPSALRMKIRSFLEKGGNLVIIPPKNIDLKHYKLWLNELNIDHFTELDTNSFELGNINNKHSLFSYVFDKELKNIKLPKVYQHYKLSNKTNNSYKIISIENRESFISQYNVKKGKVYLFTTSLNYSCTNFSNTPLFVPVFINMATHIENNQKLYYRMNDSEPIETTKEEEDLDLAHIVNENNDFIVNINIIGGEKKWLVHNQINQSGHYNLTDKQNLARTISFNYDSKESRLECFSAEEINQLIKNMKVKILNSKNGNYTETIKDLKQKKYLWKIFLILCLIFIGLEIILIKFIKT